MQTNLMLRLIYLMIIVDVAVSVGGAIWVASKPPTPDGRLIKFISSTTPFFFGGWMLVFLYGFSVTEDRRAARRKERKRVGYPEPTQIRYLEEVRPGLVKWRWGLTGALLLDGILGALLLKFYPPGLVVVYILGCSIGLMIISLTVLDKAERGSELSDAAIRGYYQRKKK